MGGEYLVELAGRALAYLGRSLLRWRSLRRAAGWLPVKGLIRSVTRDGSVVEVLITYQFEGGYYCDYHTRDLFSTKSAEEFASRFPAETSCVIRINPMRPEETVLFDNDQIVCAPVTATK